MLVNHFPIDAIDCEQSLIFLLSHRRLRAFIIILFGGSGYAVRNEG